MFLCDYMDEGISCAKCPFGINNWCAYNDYPFTKSQVFDYLNDWIYIFEETLERVANDWTRDK